MTLESLPVVDRMAILYHGLAGGIVWRGGYGGPCDHYNMARALRYNVTRHYDCDIFMHSWSLDQQDLLLSSYNPISYSIEKQEMFGFPGTGEAYIEDGPGVMVGPGLSPTGLIFRMTSRWKSMERAVKLMRDYEIKNGFRYKWVAIARIDLIFLSKIDVGLLDQWYVYVADEPYHGIIPGTTKFWDHRAQRLEVSDTFAIFGAHNFDKFTSIFNDIFNDGKYVDISWDSESVMYLVLMNILDGDTNRVVFQFKMYQDIDVYRIAMNDFSLGRQSDAKVLCAANGWDAKSKFELLLMEIDKSE